MMKKIGEGVIVSLIPRDVLSKIEEGTLKEHDNGSLWVHYHGLKVGEVAYLELTKTDYERRESLLVSQLIPISTEKVRKKIGEEINLPCYKFSIKEKG